MSIDLHDKFHEYMKFFWLRPENGLLVTYKSAVFADLQLESPSLDVSCGDGAFMFIHQGGTFADEYDMFSDTAAGSFKHDKFIDIYDHATGDIKVSIVNQPQRTLTYGTDWKQGLLDKAAKLNLYENLVQHDNNHMPMPLPADHFKSVYSNSIYWIKDPGAVAHDIHRMLAPGGIAALEVLTPHMFDTFDRIGPILGDKAIDILDRQRRATMPGRRTYRDWLELFEGAGFNIEDVRCIFPNRLLTDIWNVGLRPISHLLVEMANSQGAKKRNEIKQEWVEILENLMVPLLSLPPDRTVDDCTYLLFVLRK